MRVETGSPSVLVAFGVWSYGHAHAPLIVQRFALRAVEYIRGTLFFWRLDAWAVTGSWCQLVTSLWNVAWPAKTTTAYRPGRARPSVAMMREVNDV